MTEHHVSRARIADVAREAGVSKAAVSFAFNNPERLRPETADRIRRVATELGYRPDPVARMLTAGSTATIGILSPEALSAAFANPFFALFAEGVATVTEQRGFGLLFISPIRGSLEEAAARATVDGVIVIGLDRHHPEVESIRRAGLATVLVDAPGSPEQAAIQSDDTAGARAAAIHLVALGHRDVLILSLDASPGQHGSDGVAARRLLGYSEAIHASGMTIATGQLRHAPATFEAGEMAFTGAWSDGLRPTAVLSMSDVAAAGVLQGARTLGLTVPGDVSVVGFDDLPLTRYTDPPLTTVHQPVRLKGEVAATMLFEALASGRDLPAEQRVLETHLVVRGSTGPPSATRRAAGS